MSKSKLKFIVRIGKDSYIQRLASIGTPFPAIGVTSDLSFACKFDSTEELVSAIDWIVKDCADTVTLIPVEE